MRLALIAALVAVPAAASAQADDTAVVREQELGGVLGAEFGGRVSPGGLHVGGSYLYQMTDDDWFEGGLSFTFGGGGAACFRDRDNDFICDHGVMEGRSGEIAAGVRRFFFGRGQGRFLPYARAALGLRLIGYGADGLTGLAIPLQLGGGIRIRVDDRISLSAGSELRLGPAWFDEELGSEPHVGLAVHAGIEFAL